MGASKQEKKDAKKDAKKQAKKRKRLERLEQLQAMVADAQQPLGIVQAAPLQMRSI